MRKNYYHENDYTGNLLSYILLLFTFQDLFMWYNVINFSPNALLHNHTRQISSQQHTLKSKHAKKNVILRRSLKNKNRHQNCIIWQDESSQRILTLLRSIYATKYALYIFSVKCVYYCDFLSKCQKFYTKMMWNLLSI